MEQKLGMSALTLSVVGWVCLLVLTLARSSPAKNEDILPIKIHLSKPFVWLAFLTPLLIWLLSLPSEPPFSAGQGWGRGFLLGGIMSSVAIAVTVKTLSKHQGAPRSAATLSLFSSLIVCSIPLIWMRHTVIETLLGAALGWVVVSLIWLLGIRAQDSNIESEICDWVPALILNGAVSGTTVFAVAILGVYRDFLFPDVVRGTYSAIAVAFAASTATASLIGILVDDILAKRKARSGLAKAATSSYLSLVLWLVIPLCAGYFLSIELLDDLALFGVIALGLLLGGVSWLLVWMEREPIASSVTVSPQVRAPVAAIFISLCAVMLAYQIMQGFGIGMMLLATMPVASLLIPASDDSSVSGERVARLMSVQSLHLVASFMAIIVVSRVFATRFRADLYGSNLDDQFAMFGFLAGTILPALLVSLWFGTARADDRPPSSSLESVPRLFSIGILSLTALTAMLLLWGVKVIPAFLFGMALAPTVFTPSGSRRSQTSAVALLSLSMALTLAQWAQSFLPAAEVSRTSRLHFLLWTVGGAVVLVLIIDYGSRLLRPRRKENVSSTGGNA